VFGVPPDRIDVIHHGVEPSFAPGIASPLPAGVVAGHYVLFVGDPIGEPRKNFFLLYEAYRRAFSSTGGAPALVVAGPRAPQLPGVVHVGNLGEDLATRGDERLRALYRGAIVLALASYHETFGMPVLEAMACGTPVIASDASSLPEVGGDAALYVAPDDASAWADALLRVAGDPSLRDRLRIAGLGRATHFSWDTSADAHLAVFRATASS
jgi:glycosyltransferase involved in cell wall biosynthesis